MKHETLLFILFQTTSTYILTHFIIIFIVFRHVVIILSDHWAKALQLHITLSKKCILLIK